MWFTCNKTNIKEKDRQTAEFYIQSQDVTNFVSHEFECIQAPKWTIKKYKNKQTLSSCFDIIKYQLIAFDVNISMFVHGKKRITQFFVLKTE